MNQHLEFPNEVRKSVDHIRAEIFIGSLDISGEVGVRGVHSDNQFIISWGSFGFDIFYSFEYRVDWSKCLLFKSINFQPQFSDVSA